MTQLIAHDSSTDTSIQETFTHNFMLVSELLEHISDMFPRTCGVMSLEDSNPQSHVIVFETYKQSVQDNTLHSSV